MKRVAPYLVSIAILAIIYWRVDTAELWNAIRHADPFFVGVGVLLTIPVVGLITLRLSRMAPRGQHFGYVESLRISLASAVLKLALPSGAGVVGKVWFLKQRGHMSYSLAASLVLFEKVSDVLALLALCAAGILLTFQPASFHYTTAAIAGPGFLGGAMMLGSRPLARAVFGGVRRILPRPLEEKVNRAESEWRLMQDHLLANPWRLADFALESLLISLLFLLQIHVFALALRPDVPLMASIGWAPLAVLAGLMPLTLGGYGTRDAAFVLLYGAYLDAPAAAALGLLSSLRYLIPAVIGAPFVGEMRRRYAPVTKAGLKG